MTQKEISILLEELLIDDSILSHESSDSNFEDNPLIPRPPLEPPDAETDAGEEIPVVMNDKDEDVDYSYFMFVIFDKKFSLLSAESKDTIFDPGAGVQEWCREDDGVIVERGGKGCVQEWCRERWVSSEKGQENLLGLLGQGVKVWGNYRTGSWGLI
nr:hypothetical protein [Tanacetum cinerariifolium]